LPYSPRAELAKELRKLLQIKCIEPSNSPYASDLVPGAQGWKFENMCRLPCTTVADRYPIPRIDELTNAVRTQNPVV